MGFSLRCPVCRVKFKWEDPTKGFPEFCPNPECESRIAHDRADDDIVMPFVRTTGKTASIDRVYRDMERGSEVRAELAGLSGAEMSPIKITDLRPTRHEGDVAAPPLQGSALALQQHMEAMNARGGQFGFGAGASGSEWSAGVAAGPEPNAGARTRTILQQHHGQITRGTAVSDRPANEVLQPGYRRRG